MAAEEWGGGVGEVDRKVLREQTVVVWLSDAASSLPPAFPTIKLAVPLVRVAVLSETPVHLEQEPSNTPLWIFFE